MATIAPGGSVRRSSVPRIVGGLIGALVLAVVASAAAPAGVLAASGRYLDPIFTGVRVDSDMTYGSVLHTDGSVEPLKLDLYRPVGDTAKNRPVVIYVHGGGSEVDKAFERNAMVGRMFAKRGFVGAVIQYRAGTNGMAQDAAWDLRAAVRYFKKNAASLRVSASRIIVMGVSAGATTALTATFNPNDAGTSGNPGYPSTVAAGISMSGTATEHWNISFGEAPVAMIVAQDDHPFYGGTLATCNETKAYGNVCEMFIYPNGGHPPGFWLSNAKQIIEQSSAFICRNVLGPVVCRDRNGDGRVD